MMGLRERKKIQARTRILDAAHELFLLKPYDQTSIGEIAERADLSAGTLYNYFPSKGELLLALITESDGKYAKEAIEMIAQPAESAEQALTDIMVLGTEHCVDQLGKSIWRQVSAIAITNVDSTFGQQYAVTTKKHEKLVVDMMARLKVRGDFLDHIVPEDAAHYIFSMKSMLFAKFISIELMSIDDHRKEVRQGVGYFLNGICTK